MDNDTEPKFMIAFASPKRSTPVINVAAKHALALNAELILCRIIPDAEKVGVVAQLIATDRPMQKAKQHIETVVAALKAKGVRADGITRVGKVGPELINVAVEQKVSLIFIATVSFEHRPRFYMARDPIVHYLVENSPISLCLVRPDDPSGHGPFQWQSSED